VKAASTYLAIAAVALVSCAEPKGPLPKTDRYMVTAPHTPFYHYGPAQGMGADFMLMKGQNVTLIKRSFGYSKVMTADGQSGYVATDDIGPAPAPTPTPKPKRKPEPEPDYSDYLPPPRRAPGESVQPRPLETPEGLPAPEPESPPFRY